MVQDLRHRHLFDVGDGLCHVAHKRRFITASAVGEGSEIRAVRFDQQPFEWHDAQSRTDVVGLWKTHNTCETEIKTHGQ
jgi:hypothetical protein